MIFIFVSDIPFPDDVERTEVLSDGTIIRRLFKRTVIIETNNPELINWILEEDTLNIYTDEYFDLFYIPNDSLFDLQWTHKHNQYKGNNTYLFWDLWSGGNFIETSKHLCIIDTGVASHPDLNENRLTITFQGEQIVALTINGNHITKHYSIDDNSQYIHPHGTHCAGIACAIGNNQMGICGAYWKQKFFSINVFEEFYFMGRKYVGARISSILNALDIVKDISEIRTINMSLGGSYNPTFYSALLDAFEALRENEKIVVVASGNNGLDLGLIKILPAYVRTNNSFTVGSNDVRGLRSWFSNYNYTLVDLFVSGGTVLKGLKEGKYTDEDILSTIPNDSTEDYLNIIEENGVKYGYMAGTSMASPYACGLINILYEYWNLLGYQNFDDICTNIRKQLVGATYNHTQDLFEENSGGGILDANLLKYFTWIEIYSEPIYDDNTGKLTFQIRNPFIGSIQYFITLGNKCFVSPNEIQNNPNLIRYVSGSIGGRQILTIEISISPDEYYSYSSIGLLVARMYNGQIWGFYSKYRIYNIIECPIPPIDPRTGLPCSNIQIRCDDEDIFPFEVSRYHPLESGLVSYLASKTQRRLFFFFNSQKNQYGYYPYFYPVATNGLCLNTTNLPFNSIPFQVRDDATINDFVYAIYSIYTQLRDFYEKGILIKNGDTYKIWYIFDYNEWRNSGKTIYQRKKLPEEFILDNSYCRFDKIGTVVKAILYMLYWSKVIFSVDYTLKYSNYYNYSYGARYKYNEFSNLSVFEYTFNYPTSSALYSSGMPLLYQDNNGYYRYRWNDYNDPYWTGQQTPPNVWILDENKLYNNDIVFNRDRFPYTGLGFAIIGDRINIFTPTQGVGNISWNSYTVKLAKLPYELKLPPSEPVNTYETYYDYQEPIIDFNYVSAFYGDFSTNLMGEPLEWRNFGIEKRDKLYTGFGTFGFEYFQIDTARLCWGNGVYVKHNIVCAEINVPVCLDIVLSYGQKDHYSSAGHRLDLPNKNYSFDFPTKQTGSCSFRVIIEKYDKNLNSFVTILDKTYYYSIGNKGGESIIKDRMVADLFTGEYLKILIKPINFEQNPTHTLLIPFFDGETPINIPSMKDIVFVNAPNNGVWNNYYTTSINSVYNSTVYGYGAYTRNCSIMCYIANSLYTGFQYAYPDIRGLPIDDYFNNILSFLGLVEITKDGNVYRNSLQSCGWSKKGANDYTGEVVIDQCPPYRYPYPSEITQQNINQVRLVAISKGFIRVNSNIEYSKGEIEPVLNIVIPCVNAFNINYISPNNHLLYKNIKRFAITGIINSNIPDLTNLSESEIAIDNNIYEIEYNSDYYIPDTINLKFQFPKHTHYCYPVMDKIKIILFICQNNDINDYKPVLIPNLRGLKFSEANNYSDIIEIVNLGKCLSSFDDGVIADQFPRGGIWYIRKELQKPKIYILTGNGDISIVSKILNYSS